MSKYYECASCDNQFTGAPVESSRTPGVFYCSEDCESSGTFVDDMEDGMFEDEEVPETTDDE